MVHSLVAPCFFTSFSLPLVSSVGHSYNSFPSWEQKHFAFGVSSCNQEIKTTIPTKMIMSCTQLKPNASANDPMICEQMRFGYRNSYVFKLELLLDSHRITTYFGKTRLKSFDSFFYWMTKGPSSHTLHKLRNSYHLLESFENMDCACIAVSRNIMIKPNLKIFPWGFQSHIISFILVHLNHSIIVKHKIVL